VQVAVAVATVLLESLFEGTLLGNVSLLMAVIAEVIAASALKEGTLYQTTSLWG